MTPTGKLQIKPADQVRSLPVGWSAGPHYLYNFFFPVADFCIITALDVAYLRSFTCHIGSHRLKVMIKSGDIVFIIGRQFQNHMAPVNCATPATLWSCHLSRKNVGRTATASTRRSPGSSVRTAAAGIIAAVWDTSAENS